MYWIRDCTGNLVNVASARKIVKNGQLHPNTITVQAIYAGSELPAELFKGTATEVGNYVDHLFARLAKHQEHEYVAD